MKIIGFVRSKISAERKEKIEGSLSIDQKIDIKDLVKEKNPFSDEIDAIRIKYTFSVIYSKKVAKIEFEGSVLVLPEKHEMDAFMKDWDSKKIPESLRVSIFNFILSKCSLKALALEEELSLPLHMQMPKLTSQKD
ncbi:hypothetical protein GOV14_01895 [Candidatus Pacearchaeota archaeon]|nr:hypothetical protein [Candidatus Pacearchaeota archaeon]